MSPAFRKALAVAVGAALLMGLTAAPLSAAKPEKKFYRLDITPHEVENGNFHNFSATFTNTSPDGVSSFNSLTLTVPEEFTFDAANVSVEDGQTGYTIDVATAPPYTITVTGLSPVGAFQSVSINVAGVEVDVDPLSTCGPQNFYWGSDVWTGSNTGGNTFVKKQVTSGPDPDQDFTTVYEGSASVPSGGTASTGDGLSATNVGATCAQDVTLERTSSEGTEYVWLLKPEGSATWVIEVDAWPNEPADAPMPWTQVTTDDPGDPSAVWSDIQWCLGSWSPSDPTNTSGLDADPTPGAEVSCLLGQEIHVAGSGFVMVTEYYYLDGDWGAKRG